MGHENHDEQVQLLQEGKIDFLQFIMNSEHSEEYLKWCDDHATEPSNISAEFYYDMAYADSMSNQ